MKNKVTVRVFGDLSRRVGFASLWYIGIFAVIFVALRIVFYATGLTDVAASLAQGLSVGGSSVIYLLILGIVFPLVYFPYYIEAGVTRRQFALGLFATAALFSFCLAALRVPLQIVAGNPDPLFASSGILTGTVYGAAGFLIGWTSVIGFHFMRGVPIIAGILCAVAMFFGLRFLSSLPVPPWAQLTLMALALCAAGLLLLQAVKRIALRA
jgi:hypothetical protein